VFRITPLLMRPVAGLPNLSWAGLKSQSALDYARKLLPAELYTVEMPANNRGIKIVRVTLLAEFSFA